jgi:hypothetical protein
VSLLSELNTIITGLGLPVETGVFSGKAPAEYIVRTCIQEMQGNRGYAPLYSRVISSEI